MATATITPPTAPQRRRPADARGRAAARRTVHPAARRAATRGRVPARARRRLAALALLALVAVVVVLIGVPGGAADASSPAQEVVVVVGPGQTVWDLALAHAPSGADPRSYVAEVVAHNGVQPTALQPGTVLRLPQR